MKRALKGLGFILGFYAVLWIIGAIGAGLDWIFNLAPTFFGIAMLVGIVWGGYALAKLIWTETR